MSFFKGRSCLVHLSLSLSASISDITEKARANISRSLGAWVLQAYTLFVKRHSPFGLVTVTKLFEAYRTDAITK